MRILFAAGLALTLAACSPSDNKSSGQGYAGMAPPPPPAPVVVTGSLAAPMAEDAALPVEVFTRQDLKEQGSPSTQEFLRQQKIDQQEPGGGGQQPAQLIAYTYGYTFRAPPTKMEGLLNAHKAACEQAGPAKCYVVNSQISGVGDEKNNGFLQVRAAADWVKTFRTGVADSLKPFDADLDSSNDTAEDLTVQIVDSEARLKSMKTMRDRLMELLRNRPGRLSDLLEIEREFARVQADIDAHESVLAALKLRVAMSVMTLSYTPKYEAVSESVWRPLGDSFGNFVPNMASTLAKIVEFIGEVLPVVLILALFVWLAMWLFRRRRKKPAKPGPLAPKSPASGPPAAAGTGG